MPTPEHLGESLRKVERDIEEGSARKRDLDRLAGDVEEELQRLRRALVEAAGTNREREAELTAIERKLDDLEAERARSAASLETRKSQLARISGVLHRLAARPPIAMLASPADPLDIVHTAMLLEAVAAGLRRDAERLIAEITRHEEVGRDILRERERLARAGAAHAAGEERLAALLEAKQAALKSVTRQRSAAAVRLGDLAASARDLRDLMRRVEKLRAEEEAAAREAAVREAAARERPDVITPEQPSGQGVAGSTAGGSTGAGGAFVASLPEGPGIAAQKGRLAFPAAGGVSRKFGAANALGLHERGIVIATRAGARVVSPFDGKVIYAGPFRGYGQIVMIDHGEGYLTLMAGMSAIDVQVGQGVLSGEPVARMPASGAGTGAKTPGEGLYVEFRHEGAPIDPLPWWSARTNKVER